MTTTPAGASKSAEENKDAVANAKTAGARKEAETLPQKPSKIAKQIKPTTNEGTNVNVDPSTGANADTGTAGLATEQVKPKRATRTKKDTLKGIEDFSKLPVAVHIGQVAASVDEYSGRAILSLSLVGWVGEAPFKILADDIDQLEDAIANLREQLA